MRFGIFRRFSYLIHRRTRSDSALLTQLSEPTVLPSSISFDGHQPTRIIDTVLPPAPVLSPLLPIHVLPDVEKPLFRAKTISSSLHATQFSPDCSIPEKDPLLRLSAVQKHAAEVAAQSSQLKASIEALQVEVGYVEGAACQAKNDLEQARSLANRQKRNSTDLELQVNAKRHELAQCEIFAQALSEADLLALAGTRSGSDFEESAVEAIRETSCNEPSIWSRIVSLVIGPRTPENYVNSINMTLQARQELRHWRKVSNFWKKTAREDDTSTGAPTPSASNLSEIRETLNDERKHAVEALRQKRKTLGLNNTFTSSGSLSSSNESVKLAYRLPVSHPSFTSVMSTMSNSASSKEISTTQSIRRLAPLASDIFKQDLLFSHSSQRLFSSSEHETLWSPSAEKNTIIAAKPSDKALAKRKATDVRDSVVFMPSGASFDSNVSQIGSSAVDSSSSTGQLSSWASFKSSASRQVAPISHPRTASKRSSDNHEPPSHNSLMSAERALESFERICNRFSSGSNVGSLQSISEESSLSSAAAGPQIVVHISEGLSSESLSSAPSSLIAAAKPAEHAGIRSNFPIPISDTRFEGDVTSVESGSEGSNLTSQENETTFIEIEAVGKEQGTKASVDEDCYQKPYLIKKSRLPIFKIPNRLSQMSRMTGSSSKKSLSSFRSRNSSSTVSTMASKEVSGPRSVKNFLVGMPSFIPVLPLRIVKKGKPNDSTSTSL
ncbi:hypothetical protein J3R30DRAFT_3452070 [Lentinula aciculospora]|uniref:Uncharacterized protein n=1 Tax=Lentinula aciculospora TaxID=153920 RepID=A0A9W9AKG7_9AGAR|nr:hypothetical protein J3R30DRAFT_3452070 [Lentinula aciculospora]